MREILGRGVATAGIGAAAGAALAIPGIGLVRALLTAAPPSAAAAIGIVSAVLMAVSLAACWIPARRALAVDPVASLRSE